MSSPIWSPIEIGSAVGVTVVALGLGFTAADVPAPVSRPPPRGRATLSAAGAPARVPVRIRQRVTVPFTGEITPPAAWELKGRSSWMIVQADAPQSYSWFGT